MENKQPNYKIYYFDENHYDKITIDRFYAKNDEEAFNYLEVCKKKNPDKELYYATIHYIKILLEDGTESPPFDIEEHSSRHEFISSKKPWHKAIIDETIDFLHYWFIDKPLDFKYWLRDLFYLLKNKEAYSNQWNLDIHILDSIERNVPSLIENSHALAFIDEAIMRVHGKDPGFDLKKFHEEHCSGYPKDVEDLAMKIQDEEYNKLLLYVKLYRYYSGFGYVDFNNPEEVAFDKMWRCTLPIKKGTYDEMSSYDELDKLCKKYWDKIWDWMKAYGDKLND